MAYRALYYFNRIKFFLLSIPPVVRWISLLSLVIFLGIGISSHIENFAIRYLILQSQLSPHWYVAWQLFTDSFIHFRFSLLILNLFCLYNCLPAEKRLGSKRFALWLGIAVLSSGAISWLLGLLIPTYSSYIGSMSIGLFALTLMTRIWRNKQILFWAIPQPVSARITFYILIGISLLSAVSARGWVHLLALIPSIIVALITPIPGEPSFFSLIQMWVKGQKKIKMTQQTQRKSHLKVVPPDTKTDTGYWN